MESLFGCNSAASVPKEATRKSVLPPVEQENKVLDPKKSQNIAILLRALNVTREEVSEALIDGMYLRNKWESSKVLGEHRNVKEVHLIYHFYI